MNTKIEQTSNFAVDSKRSVFFDVFDEQKVSLRLVDQQLQLYLDSPHANPN